MGRASHWVLLSSDLSFNMQHILRSFSPRRKESNRRVVFNASGGRSEVAEVCVLAAYFFFCTIASRVFVFSECQCRDRGDNPAPVTPVFYPFSVTKGALFADYHSSSQFILLAVNPKSFKCTLQIRKKAPQLLIFHVDRINQDVIMTPNEIT